MADLTVNLTPESGLGATFTPNNYYTKAAADLRFLQRIADLISQADAEAGVATDAKAWSALRVAQAIEILAQTLANLRVGTDVADGVLRITGQAIVDPQDVVFANPMNCDCLLSNNHNPDIINGDTVINLINLPANRSMSGIITILNDGAGGHAVTLGAAFTIEIDGSSGYDDTAGKYNLINWYWNEVEVFYVWNKQL